MANPPLDDEAASPGKEQSSRPAKKRRVVETAPRESQHQQQEHYREPDSTFRREENCKGTGSIVCHELLPARICPTGAYKDIKDQQQQVQASTEVESSKEAAKVAPTRRQDQDTLRRQEVPPHIADQGSRRYQDASLIERVAQSSRPQTLPSFASRLRHEDTTRAAMLQPAPLRTSSSSQPREPNAPPERGFPFSDESLNWYYQREAASTLLQQLSYDRPPGGEDSERNSASRTWHGAASSTYESYSSLPTTERMIEDFLRRRTGEHRYPLSRLSSTVHTLGDPLAHGRRPTFSNPEHILDGALHRYYSNVASMPPSLVQRELPGSDSNLLPMRPPFLPLAASLWPPASNASATEGSRQEGRGNSWPESGTYEDFARRALQANRLRNDLGYYEEAQRNSDLDARRRILQSGQRLNEPPVNLPPRVLPPQARRAVPPCTEGPLPKLSERIIVPLATDEDANWLSEFLCFVRSEMVEVFRANGEDVASRMNSKKVAYQQIGIRCRYCAHLPHHDRAIRSSAFPSSVERIYQSLTMIIREHFARCDEIPQEKMDLFGSLRTAPSHGATGSKA